jgi:hypothetical protein
MDAARLSAEPDLQSRIYWSAFRLHTNLTEARAGHHTRVSLQAVRPTGTELAGGLGWPAPSDDADGCVGLPSYRAG